MQTQYVPNLRSLCQATGSRYNLLFTFLVSSPQSKRRGCAEEREALNARTLESGLDRRKGTKCRPVRVSLFCWFFVLVLSWRVAVSNAKRFWNNRRFARQWQRQPQAKIPRKLNSRAKEGSQPRETIRGEIMRHGWLGRSVMRYSSRGYQEVDKKTQGREENI
jgi:hypothetical protein